MTAITDSSSLKTILHGVLVNVDDAGVLITGESGTGKSECALELVARQGHRLVADDVVEVSRIGDRLYGRSAEGFADLMNTPGLGILALRELFGGVAFEASHSIDLCIQFEAGKEPKASALFGSEIAKTEILGLILPRFVFSACHSRNLPLLVETAVKLLKNGENAAELEFLGRHDELVFPSGSCLID